MKYDIFGYNQDSAVDMVGRIYHPKGKMVDTWIDLKDLAIMRYLSRYWPNAEKIIIDGEVYAKVKSRDIVDDMPILRIDRAGVCRRLRKLRHFGLIDYTRTDEYGNRTCYRVGDNYKKLYGDEQLQTL